MRNRTYAMVLTSLVVQISCGCSDDEGGSNNTGDGGGRGGEAAAHAGASGAATGHIGGGAAGTAGEASGGASDAAGSSGDAAGSTGDAGGSVGAAGDASSDNGGAPDTGYDQSECPPCERGCATGDPHLITFDGVYYDFQAPGEYVLAYSDGLEVQARLQVTDGCDQAAHVAAVAFGTPADRISVHADAARFVRLGDGATHPLGELGVEFGDWYLVGACGGVVATSAAGDQIIVHFIGESWLDVEVRPRVSDSAWGGLFGNFDGDETNDIALPDGTPLPNPVPWEALYSAFGGSWLVTGETSLFVYDDDESAADYAGGAVPGVVDLSAVPADVAAAAEAGCADVSDPALQQGCLTDASCSGADAEVAAAWFLTEPEPEMVLAVDPPTMVEMCFIPGIAIMNLEDNTLDCPAHCVGLAGVWGTDIYTDDSGVCAAAVHAGLIDDDVGGTVTVNPEPGQDAYVGSTRNGVTTEDWGAYGSSFSLSL